MRSLLVLAALFLASPASAQPVDRWRGHIDEASAHFDVPKEWIRRVMRAESGGLTMLNGRPITSRAGAMGLMQLMPGTWAEMRAAYRLGADPHDPRDNILAGTAYLRAMPGIWPTAGVCQRKPSPMLPKSAGLLPETGQSRGRSRRRPASSSHFSNLRHLAARMRRRLRRRTSSSRG